LTFFRGGRIEEEKGVLESGDGEHCCKMKTESVVSVGVPSSHIVLLLIYICAGFLSFFMDLLLLLLLLL